MQSTSRPQIWKRAREHNAPYDHVKALWQSKRSLTEAAAVLHKECMRYLYPLREKNPTAQVEQEMKGEVLREKRHVLGSDANKILMLIGQHIVPDWWNEHLAFECYKAAEKTRHELNLFQWDIYTELLGRLETKGPPDKRQNRTEEELEEGMKCWRQLKEFRNRRFPAGGQINKDLAWKTLYAFFW